MRRGRTALIAAAVVAAMLLFMPAASLGAPGSYTVVPGDTLSGIAQQFGVSVEQLAELNGIADPDFILSGQVLRLPGADGGAPASATETGQGATGDTYRVQLGDTVSEIAERFGLPVAAIVEANGLADPHFIVEGQVLTIPAVESALVRPISPEIEAMLEEFAAAEGLDAGLVKALAYVESGWQQGVVSGTGVIGVMQIQPTTAYWLETEVFGYDLNIETSVYDNIKAGVRYLRILQDLTGDIEQAVAAYYQGYAALSLGVIYEETVQYVASVKAIRDLFWA